MDFRKGSVMLTKGDFVTLEKVARTTKPVIVKGNVKRVQSLASIELQNVTFISFSK